MSELMTAIQSEPYCASLGVQVEDLNEQGARMALPFKEENSNPGQVLHGGVAASMIDIGGLAVGRAALGEEAGPFHTFGVEVCYLAAAKAEPIVAVSTLLRRGKELAFVDVAIETADGKAIARGLSIVRGRFGAEAAPDVATIGDDGASDPGIMGPNLPKRVPFIGGLGMQVEHMTGGRSRIAMPFLHKNGNGAGGVHEGAILAHLDTTGAMAAWAETGAGMYKASTVGIQAKMVAPAKAEDLIAYGTMRQRDREVFWSDVEVAAKSDGRVVARGTVLYRIVIP